jgi:hypothetical protein
MSRNGAWHEESVLALVAEIRSKPVAERNIRDWRTLAEFYETVADDFHRDSLELVRSLVRATTEAQKWGEVALTAIAARAGRPPTKRIKRLLAELGQEPRNRKRGRREALTEDDVAYALRVKEEVEAESGKSVPDTDIAEALISAARKAGRAPEFSAGTVRNRMSRSRQRRNSERVSEATRRLASWPSLLVHEIPTIFLHNVTHM